MFFIFITYYLRFIVFSVSRVWFSPFSFLWKINFTVRLPTQRRNISWRKLFELWLAWHLAISRNIFMCTKVLYNWINPQLWGKERISVLRAHSDPSPFLRFDLIRTISFSNFPFVDKQVSLILYPSHFVAIAEK